MPLAPFLLATAPKKNGLLTQQAGRAWPRNQTLTLALWSGLHYPLFSTVFCDGTFRVAPARARIVPMKWAYLPLVNTLRRVLERHSAQAGAP